MDVRQAWQFPAAQVVLSLLSGSHSVPSTTSEALERVLNSSEDPLLAQIHVKLLRLPAHSQKKWRASIARYINNHPQYFDDDIPRPLDDDTYDNFTPYERLILLHALAEAVLSEHPPDASIQELRLYPTGFDALRNQYWYFGDAQRVYREPGPVARKKAETNAKLAAQQLKLAEKDARRREREEKREATERKRDEKRKRDAEKWAPRVAVSRSTRASRRLQQKAEQKDQQHDEEQMRDSEEDEERDVQEKEDVVMDDWLLREIGITSDDDEDDDDGKELPKEKKQQTEQEAPRRSGRRRKSTQRAPSPPAKRPREKDPSPPPPLKRKEFADPKLRICTHWEVVSSSAEELRAFMERFGPRAELAPVERSLLKQFDEILPEMDEAEARVKREAERKAKTQFLMMNQKRSTRVQAIYARREEEARLEAEREEKEREEAARIASHERAVFDAISFLVRDQSRDIRGVRREFGMDEVISRDEAALQKHEKEKALHAIAMAPVRRSSRTHRTKQHFDVDEDVRHDATAASQAKVDVAPPSIESAPIQEDGTIADETSSEAARQNGSVVPKNEDVDIDNESSIDKRMEVQCENTASEDQKPNGELENQNREESTKSELKEEELQVVSHVKEEGETNDLEDRGTIIDSMDETTKSSPEAERTTDADQKRSQFSSACPEEYISAKFTWSTNSEDKLPMRVLDKFFFALRENFADAPLENCENPESEMVGFGILIPPTTAPPDVERVEIPRIVEWMFEYGGTPKIWVKSEHAWYELREPSVEYQKVFVTARRKFEICARVAIMGDTMRGPQLNYSSIVDYLSYPYGNMLDYKDSDVLSEKRYIVSQMESLQKRSLLQSGFIKELMKRIRAEDRKAAQERAKLLTHEAALQMRKEEEFASMKEDDMVIVPPTKEKKAESECAAMNEKASTKQAGSAKAKDPHAKKPQNEKLVTKKPPRRRSGKPVPRAVSSIVNGILRAAMKSHKTPRRRKPKPESGGKEGLAGTSPNAKTISPKQAPAASKVNRGLKKNGTVGTTAQHMEQSGVIGNGHHASQAAKQNSGLKSGMAEPRILPKQSDSTNGGAMSKRPDVAATAGQNTPRNGKSIISGALPKASSHRSPKTPKKEREHPLAAKMVGHGMSAFVALPRQQGMTREKELVRALGQPGFARNENSRND